MVAREEMKTAKCISLEGLELITEQIETIFVSLLQ